MKKGVIFFLILGLIFLLTFSLVFAGFVNTILGKITGW
jgi:hypothetical protein